MAVRELVNPLPALNDHDERGGSGMTADDLAELIHSFDAVTEQLQGTHAMLRSEVARLKEELRQANQQLKRSEDLAALGQMAAGIAHEIRNPLGSIRLYASMLTNDLSDRPESRSMAEKIDQATVDLDVIVGDVLAFSRSNEPCFTPISARTLLRDATESCAGLIQQYDINIAWDITENEESSWMTAADGRLMNRAIGNVLRNAVEASAKGGRIELGVEAGRFVPESTRAARKGAEPATQAGGGVHFAEGITLRIKDFGPGLPTDCNMDRVFQPFFTTKSSGTGLGLAIAHRIVDAHGGMISIGNHESGGAVVRIVLRRWE